MKTKPDRLVCARFMRLDGAHLVKIGGIHQVKKHLVVSDPRVALERLRLGQSVYVQDGAPAVRVAGALKPR